MIKQFSVGASRTTNLGNFESLRVEATVTMDVNEGDDYTNLRVVAQTNLRQLMEDTYTEYRKKEKAK